MNRTGITQQTSTSVALRGELTHEAPSPRALRRGTFHGPLQWALEGSGWGVVRPSVDFVLLCLAVVLALGGLYDTVHVSSVSAPLLALPPLVLVLFYLRGLYRTRMRALILDGVVPVVSAVSVGAMAVAVIGHVPQRPGPEPERLAAGMGICADRRGCRPCWALAAAEVGACPAARGQAGPDHGRRRRRRAGRAPPGEPPRVRACAGGLPR